MTPTMAFAVAGSTVARAAYEARWTEEAFAERLRAVLLDVG